MGIQFTTTDLALAAFLSIKDFEIINIEKGIQRKIFVFNGSSELNDLVKSFNFGKKDLPEVIVDAREILRAYRDLKVKLHNI